MLQGGPKMTDRVSKGGQSYGFRFSPQLLQNKILIGAIIILCRKIAISLEPNLRWTSDQSANSSLSVAVQEKKTRALYLSWLKRGGPLKFENTFFQIAKLRFSSIFVDFQFSKTSQGT